MDGRRAPARAGGAVAATGIGLAGLLTYQARKYRRRTTRFELDEPSRPGTTEFARMLEAVTAAPLRPGNRVTALRNGVTLDKMLEAIGDAKETVNFSSYIYWPGTIADRFSEAFMDKAGDGIEVNVVVDGYGSARLDRDHLDRLCRAGVKAVTFRPPRWHTVQKLNNRMHRRILVVDGKVGFAGGVGVADMWTGDAEDPDHWRESHLRLEGPAVRDLFGGFLENWTEATGELLGGAHVPELAPFDDGVPVQVTRSSPSAGPTATTELFYAAIAGARKRLWVTTAYFSPDHAFEDALCEASRRGVDVRIVVNGRKVDKEVARQASHRSYTKLLEAGVRIFEYQRTMLHAKVLLVDDDWVNVGSANFDNRSFALDIELNVAVHDPGIAAELEGHFLEDAESAEEVDLHRWRRRPMRTRALEYATELVRQSL